MKNLFKKNFFCRGDFKPFLSKNVQIWDQFFTLFFPKDSKKLNSFDIGAQEMGAKRALNQVRNTYTKTILLSKEKIAKKLFFVAAVLHPLLVKIFKSETTYFHSKDSKFNFFLDIWFWEMRTKRRLNGTSKSEHTHTHIDGRMDGRTNWLIESIGPDVQCCEDIKYYKF